MRKVNIIFHDIVKKDVPLSSKYSVKSDFFFNLIDAIESERNKKKINIDIAIYFDDGYESIHSIIIPILKDIPYSVVAAIISDKLDSPGYITTRQLLDLYKAKIKIAAHGVSHSALAVYKNNVLQPTPLRGIYQNTPLGQGDPLSESEIEYQLVESKRKLESIINSEIDEFVLPYGLYNNSVVKIFNKAGLYKYLSTCDVGIDFGQYIKPRLLISNDMELKMIVDNIISIQNYN